MKVLIAIPAYNEAESIAKVIDLIRTKAPKYDYIVINDGSSDNTASICNDLGCPLLDLPVNLGLGGAFGSAMKYAYQKGYDAIIQIDGDGQHDPANIDLMVDNMAKTGCDVVIGSRYCDNLPPRSSLRGIGGRLISFLIRIKTHTHIGDPTSGMRLYGKKAIELFVANDFMEPEPHTLAYLLKKGFKINEVPVEMKIRETGESYLQGIKVIRYMSRVCVSILLV